LSEAHQGDRDAGVIRIKSHDVSPSRIFLTAIQ
jgi:hypothetical protein